MKRLLVAWLVVPAVVVAFAFIQWSVDPGAWPIAARAACGVVAGFAACFFLTITVSRR